MWRLLAPLLEGVLMAAVHDPEFRAWMTAEFPDCGLSELEELQSRLQQLCQERKW